MENQTIRWGLISNISNSLTDRCAANHAAIQLVNASWDKTLNELDCHLHPLDSIAIKAQVWGSDCCASKIVVQMDKLARVTVRGFKIFLDDHKLPRCLIPRYRRNRLHVLFHIRGVFIEHHALFTEYLEQGPTCGGLRASVLADFVSVLGHIEMQVLGLLGKLLTGPWMKKFYATAVDQIDHVEGIQVIKQLVQKLKDLKETPVDLLCCATDFFGNNLDKENSTLLKLREPPKDITLYSSMMTACLQAVIDVLERQYKKYFTGDWEISERFGLETKSARSHNMDAEEVIGMFSAAKQKAANATTCFLSCKMRAQKNRTIDYLDRLEKIKRDQIIIQAIQIGGKQRSKSRMNQNDLDVEASRRLAGKKADKRHNYKKKIREKKELLT